VTGQFLQPASIAPSKGASVSSESISQMAKLLIPSSSIHLLDCIGQGGMHVRLVNYIMIISCTVLICVGKFGVVYRANLSRWKKHEQEVVAVKTLKGTDGLACMYTVSSSSNYTHIQHCRSIWCK